MPRDLAARPTVFRPSDWPWLLKQIAFNIKQTALGCCRISAIGTSAVVAYLLLDTNELRISSTTEPTLEPVLNSTMSASTIPVAIRSSVTTPPSHLIKCLPCVRFFLVLERCDIVSDTVAWSCPSTSTCNVATCFSRRSPTSCPLLY